MNKEEISPEIHMENVNLSEEFDDISNDYWEDTSLFVVRTAIKREDGESKGKTTSILAMMDNKEDDNDYDGEYEELSSGLSSLSSCVENDSGSECNISPPRSPPGPTTQNIQDSKSKQNIKAAAEKLNRVTRKMFSSPITSSLTLHQLSEHFYHAYREFVFSIEEGANKKADITNLGHIIEELKAITETSSHLLLVVNAASVNPSGKEKISAAARAVMDCIDQVIAACSWETENSNVEDKCGYDTGTSESLDAVVSRSTMEGKENECYEDENKIDIFSTPKIYVKTNHEIIRDGMTVDESYQVCTENTTVTPNTLTKDTIIIKDQKLTTGDLVTVKQDVISEHETVTCKPPISPRNRIKDIHQKSEAKNFSFADEVITFENKKYDTEDFINTKSINKADLQENILHEIFVDKEFTEDQTVSEKPKMVPLRETRKKSSYFKPREDINLSPINEDKDMSKNWVVTSEKTETTYDSDSLSSFSEISEDKNYLKDGENVKPTKMTEDRDLLTRRIPTVEVGVSKKARTLANKTALRERSISTDRIIRAQKGVATDEITSLEREVLTESGFLAQKGSMIDETRVDNRAINTKPCSPTERQYSEEQTKLINREKTERRASPVSKSSLSEIMLVTDEGRNGESSILRQKDVSTEKISKEEKGITKDSEIFNEKRISNENLFSDQQITPEPPVLSDKEKSTTTVKEKLADEKRLSHGSLTTEKVLPEEMNVASDVTVFQEKGISMETLEKAVETANKSNTETEVISNSVIVKEEKDVGKKEMATEPQVQELKYFQDRGVATDRDDSTEKPIEERIHTDPSATTQKYNTKEIGIATDVEFVEQKRATEEKGVTANIVAVRQELITVESGTITDPCQITENYSIVDKPPSIDSDFSVSKRSTSERGITTDPWPQMQNCETEERSVATEPEITSQRQITNEVSTLTEKGLTTYTTALTEKYLTPEKNIGAENEVEIFQNFKENNWRVSDVDTSTDGSTFRSLSEHYSKESDELSDAQTEVINLTDEDSGPNFGLTFCLPRHDSTSTKMVSIYDIHQEESIESVEDDGNELPLSLLLKQFTKREKNNCFNIRTAIKGGEENRSESLKQFESEEELDNENPKSVTLYHQPAIVSTASQTEISSPEEKSTEDSSKDTDDNDGQPHMTPSENDYALCRALVELKWAQTSINRLESEKKLLHSQLNEVMQTGFQKGKEQLQQLIQAETMLQTFRQQHEREFQTLTHKKRELSETVNKLQSEKDELSEKLAQSEKCCEITQNKIQETIDTHKNAELAFDIGKKELNNQIAKLNQQLKNEFLEKQKLKEALKTVKTELAKLNEEFEKAKTTQRKQAEQLQEAKESSNRLLQRTNSDLLSMQKIQKTLRDSIQRLEKEKSTLEFDLKCETNKVVILQKDIDALWTECNLRKPCLDKNQIFPQDKSQKEVSWPQTQNPLQNLSQMTESQQKQVMPNRLPKVPQSQMPIKVPQKSRSNVLFQQSTPILEEQPTKTVSPLVNETEGSSQQPLWQVLLQVPIPPRKQFKMPSRPFIHAGAVTPSVIPGSDQSQKVTQLLSQNVPISEVQKDDQCLRTIINEKKLIKSKYEKEQERNRRLQRKILHLKASEYKKKQFLISKYERERKRLRLIMEKHKQNSKEVTQRLNSADVMLDIEREKNNVLQREITAMKTEKEKQAEVKFINSSQEFEELNTRLKQVELGQTIEKVNSYLEQQQLEYQLRMAERENEIVLEKNKLQEDLLQLRLSYEKILSFTDVQPNELCPSKEMYKPSCQSSVLHLPYTSKFVFSPKPVWKPSISKDITY